MNQNRYIILALFLLMLSVIACLDFFGLKPKEKEVIPPPDPPTLIAPKDSALFYTISSIDFFWNSIEGAEYYELRLIPKSGSTMTFQEPSTTSLGHYFAANYYFWSVRGYASNWEDYTDWSEERFLHVQIPIDQNSKLSPIR